MKKIYKSLVFTMATIALTSCVNDWLDLTPSDSIPSNSAITNYNDAKTALYGMYDGLQGNSTYTQYYAHVCFTMVTSGEMTCRHVHKECALPVVTK